MKKRLLALLLCAVMACALLVPAFPTAAAAEVTETDKEIRLSCTDTCVAVINKETGALTFEGDGDMVQGYDMKVRFSDYSDYIRKVTLKAGMFEIPSGAFENCTRLESVNLFSASAIYENAFKNCSSLKDIKITGNVNYISGSAFAGCISLTKFDLSKYNTFYKIDEAGALYRDTKLIRYPAGRTGSYEVRAMTREIGEGAFEGSLVHDVSSVMPVSSTMRGGRLRVQRMNSSTSSVPEAVRRMAENSMISSRCQLRPLVSVSKTRTESQRENSDCRESDMIGLHSGKIRNSEAIIACFSMLDKWFLFGYTEFTAKQILLRGVGCFRLRLGEVTP